MKKQKVSVAGALWANRRVQDEIDDEIFQNILIAPFLFLYIVYQN